MSKSSSDWLIRLIDSNTITDYDLSVQRCETDADFFDHSYAHCDIMNLSIRTAQIEFWCSKDHPSDYQYARFDTRGCYCIDNPDVGILKRIWDRIGEKKYIEEYLRSNKPIPGSTEKDMIWAMSIILGAKDETK